MRKPAISRWLRRRLLARLAEPNSALNKRRPPKASKIGDMFSQRADHPSRSAFLREHIFIQTHVPKTGGTALFHNLSSIFGAVHSMDLRLPRSVPFRELSVEDMDEVHFISGHFNYGIHAPIARRPLYIAAVREPVSRAVSAYRYFQRAKSQPEHEVCARNCFEDAWREMDKSFKAQRRDRQAEMLLGTLDREKDNWDDLCRRIDQDYLLVIPQDRIDEAIAQLREAFGLPKAPAQRANVSKAETVTPSDAISAEIRAANPLDARLCEHINATFKDRLQSACHFIAERCLAPHSS